VLAHARELSKDLVTGHYAPESDSAKDDEIDEKTVMVHGRSVLLQFCESV
jgi:hypothetical protein